MANGGANAEPLTLTECLSTREDKSSSAHDTDSGYVGEGGGTCVYFSWRNEDEFETELINMIS
jgi:hypothetical protein